MTSIQPIQDFLSLRRFAFVGVSRQPNDFSRTLFRELLARGYQPVPVHPDAADLDGQPCFHRLAEIQPPVQGALFMTTPEVTERLVEECAPAGIQRVWMFRGAGRGAASPRAVSFCEAQGLSVIPGECPFMFLPKGAWFHRVHGLLRKITGSYPR